HGVQDRGENYLVPVDAQVKVSSEIEYTCVKLGRTMAKMEGANLKVSLAFIDACRDSPFPATTKSTLAKGLSIPNNPPGSFVAFSTRAGSTADDNQEGRNGLFTSELLRHLTVPNLGVRDILDRTTQGVSARSNRNQIPGRYDELTGDFKFVVTGTAAAISSATSTEVVEKPTNEKVLIPTATTAQTAKFMDFPFADMVYVSGGSFTMGDARELGDADAKPAHSVNVTSFWMGKYEITQAQWKAIVGTNPSTFKNCDNCPVENVSWLDAVAFCNKLSEKEGKQRVYTINGNEVKIDVFANGYRLPTEAEWEYAAGGGIASRTLYGNGQDLLRSSEANYYGNRTQDGVYKAKPVTVGSYRPNDLGLYDMTGNVWEWCQDWYGNYTTGAQTNPQGAKSGNSRVFRGGSWFSSPAFGAVNMRGSNGISYRDNQLGFRVVCAP
ncbi:MAG: SUMF1/EgtB/PvdO family nonheme iron enzyme, partial [Spirosomataceae bacterium]